MGGIRPAFGLEPFTNALGLDNAATPIGLKAMRALQSLNPQPDRASNAQILFLVLNASSLTLLPVNIFMYLYKYLFKGPDCTQFTVQEQNT